MGPGGAARIDEGHDRASGYLKWTAPRADLVVGSNSRSRALLRVCAADDSAGRFVADFAAAWTQGDVPGRFDLA